MRNLLLLAASVVAWGGIHSLLASAMAKARARQVLGSAAVRAYRLGYNAFAIVSFLPVLVLTRILPDRTLYVVPHPWVFAVLGLQLLAGLCLVAALLQTDTLHFIGIRQLVQPDAEPDLVVTGLYRLIRHPLYFLGLVFIWLTPIMTVNLLTVIIMLTAYVFIGASLEERRLQREFGEAYTRYRARTPMIIPGLTFGRPAGPTTGGQSDS